MVMSVRWNLFQITEQVRNQIVDHRILPETNANETEKWNEKTDCQFDRTISHSFAVIIVCQLFGDKAQPLDTEPGFCSGSQGRLTGVRLSRFKQEDFPFTHLEQWNVSAGAHSATAFSEA